jgi:hypothetical protein
MGTLISYTAGYASRVSILVYCGPLIGNLLLQRAGSENRGMFTRLSRCFARGEPPSFECCDDSQRFLDKFNGELLLALTIAFELGKKDFLGQCRNNPVTDERPKGGFRGQSGCKAAL